MKYLILTLALMASSAYAHDPHDPYGLFNDGYQQRPIIGPTTVMPNIFGGYNYYTPGQAPVTTMPNVFGGHNVYDPNRTTQPIYQYGAP